ncbi:hypothetical protein KIN20_022376 [Parelaphostrongylus tenuis]|uniref:Uncharacterized protein n=1 Tax=Parelaphostrongylus tenuis TaxID=148309 RepID=A0AAD5MQI4_PARTN|nr:hypothetical protein KIN20_022376 [Parelaphostrongylus tenuis]
MMMGHSYYGSYVDDEWRKFRGPTFRELLAFAAKKEHSLIRKVDLCTTAQLSALVVGASVYEVLTDLPEQSAVVLRAMETVKRKQTKLNKDNIHKWMNANLPSKSSPPVNNKRFMKNGDMRLFLARYPFRILDNAVFRSFIPNVKRFLIAHLFQFRGNDMLYSKAPDFPLEEDLPHFINVLGTQRQLERNYPHLARMKQEMIVNVTHFALTYCLDWICEVCILTCNRSGYVTYGYPYVEKRKKNKEGGKSGQETADSLASDPEISKKRQAEAIGAEQDGNPHCLSTDAELPNTNVPSGDEPGTSSAIRVNVEEAEAAGSSINKPTAPTYQQSSLVETEAQPTSSKVSPSGNILATKDLTAQNDWSDLVDAALSDPDLPSQYKTMIRCLVDSNNDLKNVYASMKALKS